jgi:hypothetical protein
MESMIDSLHDLYCSFFASPSTIPSRVNSKRRTLPKGFGVHSPTVSFRSLAREAGGCLLFAGQRSNAERRSPWEQPRITFDRPGAGIVA